MAEVDWSVERKGWYYHLGQGKVIFSLLNSTTGSNIKMGRLAVLPGFHEGRCY